MVGNKRGFRRIVSVWMMSAMLILPAMHLPGCGSNGFLGLQDYQRDLLVMFGSLAISLLANQAPVGTVGVVSDPNAGLGVPGVAGMSCWDTNGNGVADEAEDTNGDGFFDAFDCQGADGTNGSDGLHCWDLNGNGMADAGEDINSDGFFDVRDCQINGSTGSLQVIAGLSCWDLNGNGSADPAEDVNEDGFFDAQDCAGVDGENGLHGTNGANGSNGVDGINCWDTNLNNIGEQSEDTDGDGYFTLMDCQGPAGINGTDGVDGQDGTDGQDGIDGTNGIDGLNGTDGQDGSAGMNCWDLNGNGIGDLQTEDTNSDGFFTAADCLGIAGIDGVDGTNGTDGIDGTNGIDGVDSTNGVDGANGVDGTNGISCWDTNGNGTGEESEDVDGDGFLTALDCQGANGADGTAGTDGSAGTNGLSCWDVNGNGIGDEPEDINDDGYYTILDCQGDDGINGTDGVDGQDGTDGIDGTNGVDGVVGVDGTNGTDGVDGTNGTDGIDGANGTDGTNGTNGLHCWDLNGNGIADEEEDIDNDGFFTAIDCKGIDGIDGQDGLNGIDGANGQDGADGADGVNCWDLDGNGIGDEAEDINGDGTVDVLDCRGSDAHDLALFDFYIDELFTVGHGSYDSLFVDGLSTPQLIEEPVMGQTEVVAFRTSVPYLFSDAGYDNPSVDQNEITMRLFFWREGPVEDCFVMRLDAFRTQHGGGVSHYGTTRFLKLNDPLVPDPAGTMIVIDLPLNNADGTTTTGLGFPADLQAGEFLAFELNAARSPQQPHGVSYALLGAEFFETHANESTLQHVEIYTSQEEADCTPMRECLGRMDCDNGIWCDGEETCSEEGQCIPGVPRCEPGGMCDETEEVCTNCHTDIPQQKAIICHVPGGNQELSMTLIVGKFAVASHLDHGDTEGFCEGECADLGAGDFQGDGID